MTSFDCEGESCWAAGWLQHSFSISNNISAQSVSLVGGGLEGPLTSEMSPDSFPTRVVPFDPAALTALFGLAGIIVVHEIYAVFRKPLLANHQQSASNWVQLAYLMQKFGIFVVVAMTVPVSLDFCLQMGQSATMSGFYLSSPLFGAMFGVVIGKNLCPEADWNQPLARRLLVLCQLSANLCMFLNACLVNQAGDLPVPQRNGIFWLSVLFIQVQTALSSLPMVPMMVMQNKLTPTSEKTFWMILGQCASNGGMLFGPGLFGVMTFLVKGGLPVSPASLMAWVHIGNAIFQSVVNVYIGWVLPTVLVPLPEEPVVPEAEACVTMLPAAQRERVVKNMVWYALERPFSISAIEVGTIMLLEVSYGWATEVSGMVFTVVAGTSLIFALLSSVFLSSGALTESGVFFGANVCGLVGVVFLFDFGTGPAGLLIADGMVYGMASVCNGIAEGWATKAAMPDTAFSVENYRVQNSMATCLARFASPIAARTLLDFGGRNVYACMQFFIVLLSTVTVSKTVTMVWENRGETQAKASNEAKKA